MCITMTSMKLHRSLVSSVVIIAALAAWRPWPGAAQGGDITVKEWPTPNAKGQYEPHDPAADARGNGWYTGFHANTIGFVAPGTGQVKEFPLPTTDSGPHGIAVDAQGGVWFTGNRAAFIGRLDPPTGKVVEYKMPDPAARDPHTPIIDASGILWFTVQSGNFVGKLDPRTGTVTLKAVATPKANPHGIDLDAKGVPYFALSASNKIGRIDRRTMDITEIVLPDGARPRRIDVAPDGAVWYTDNARGLLARLDPATGRVKEFPAPGGPKGAPWSIASTSDGIVWYTESAPDPNTLVRFDPKSEATRWWALPTKGGVVRHMVAAGDGSLWLASSGNARMIHVRPNK